MPFPGGTSDSAISPDGKLIAFTSGGIDTSDIKVWDTARERLVSVTTDGRGHSYPVWAPDSRHLAFRSLVKDGYGLSWARSDGGGQVRTLLEAKLPIIPSSISPDGRRIGYTQISTAGSMEDIWTLSIDKSDPENPKPGAAEPFLQTPGTETHVTFSPDGQWVAYASNDSGAWEAYVGPSPDRAHVRRFQAAADTIPGGRRPRNRSSMRPTMATSWRWTIRSKAAYSPREGRDFGARRELPPISGALHSNLRQTASGC